tara:strand:+ start:1044 stop:2909 length:1866 start_codon:yes stop_codon:yes gene_type:complete
LRLFINDIEFDLPNGFSIARTKQVNDIGSISDRQANYTQKIKIPRTKRNENNFNQLGFIGSQSLIPYQKNTVKLYNSIGESEIYDGYAKVFGTFNDYYDVAIYDGYISFAKAIENLNLNALDLSDVNHFKTLDNVTDSFNDLTIYKYILADYNGKALYDTSKINIDYLVPSLPISYLWNKIFTTFGYTFEGVVFDTFNFNNLWLTYPKGVSDDNPTPTTYYTNTYNNLDWQIAGGFYDSLVHDPNAPTTGSFLANNIDYLVPENGTYIISTDLSFFIVMDDDTGEEANGTLTILVNGAPVGSLKDSFETFDNSPIYLTLLQGDSLSIGIGVSGIPFEVVFTSGSITYGFLAGQNIDFNETFLDFKIKDFIDEILQRFSLTPFKDKYSNNIKFKTLTEILQTEDVDDWSASNNKFIRQTEENYIYRNYAQVNNFKYKYNDREGDYKDGSIAIENYNLPDNTTVVNSFIYAPEKLISSELPKDTNIYKLWDKEVKDDGTVNYKDLDKRFYLMRYEDFTFATSKTIGSETLTTETTITSAPFESFFKLPYDEIVAEYYDNMTLILNDSKPITADIYLNEADINGLDFSKLKFIKELGNYYILNKVINFKESGVVSCELIRVKYA